MWELAGMLTDFSESFDRLRTTGERIEVTETISAHAELVEAFFAFYQQLASLGLHPSPRQVRAVKKTIGLALDSQCRQQREDVFALDLDAEILSKIVEGTALYVGISSELSGDGELDGLFPVPLDQGD